MTFLLLMGIRSNFGKDALQHAGLVALVFLTAAALFFHLRYWRSWQSYKPYSPRQDS
ncbi:MAG: hypothetical protein ACK41V_19050 [Acidovorax sp.]|uniref:hypothetical protein n=1 Tax=Acidovorax sp. TaxID=1872122 RepID=UPI00391A5FD9